MARSSLLQARGPSARDCPRADITGRRPHLPAARSDPGHLRSLVLMCSRVADRPTGAVLRPRPAIASASGRSRPERLPTCSLPLRLRPVTARVPADIDFVHRACRRPLHRAAPTVQTGTCTAPRRSRSRSGSATSSRPRPRAADLRRAAAGSLLHRPGRRVGQPRAGTADVHGAGRQHRGRRELPEHRRRIRRRHGARPRYRPAAGRRRRNADRRSPGPAGAHGPAGDQELHPAGQEVRPRQPRPGAARSLQRRGRLRPAPGLRRGLSRPAERQSPLLRPARRQRSTGRRTSRATTR